MTHSRTEAPFVSGAGTCAAWLYLPADAGGPVPCVVMGNGFSLTRHDGIPAYAEVFADAGFAVLAFDHRHLGDSASDSPGRIRIGEQLEDWRTAVATARGLDQVDPDKVSLWGFSLGGGHAATVAADDDRLAAVLLLCPMLDGLARTLATPPGTAARILVRALAELAGREVRIPATAEPKQLGAMNLATEAAGFARSTDPDGPWRNSIGPALFTSIWSYRPVRRARAVRAPVLLALGGRDISVSAAAIRRFASNAPGGVLQEYPEPDHFDVLIGDRATSIARDQVAFLVSSGAGPQIPS